MPHLIGYFPGGAGGGARPDKILSYTGNWQLFDDGSGNWRAKFYTSGTLEVKSTITVDAFAVGGGGNGGKYSTHSGAGGGGGYTTTEAGIILMEGTYLVTIGAACGSSSLARNDGTAICTAEGGVSGHMTTHNGYSTSAGGDGGSGGCPGGYANWNQGKPGSDGSDGTKGGYSSSLPGKGQGTTTREFGEATGELYSGGGGAGDVYYNNAYRGVAVPGADGGGGDGGTSSAAPGNGEENTGGGGGGAARASDNGGTGGSGIVIIRNARAVAA